jgi:hypothetical protein
MFTDLGGCDLDQFTGAGAAVELAQEHRVRPWAIGGVRFAGKKDSNPTDASREAQPSRDPAVTTQAYVGAESRFVPPDPRPSRVAWQPRGSGS